MIDVNFTRRSLCSTQGFTAFASTGYREPLGWPDNRFNTLLEALRAADAIDLNGGGPRRLPCKNASPLTRTKRRSELLKIKVLQLTKWHRLTYFDTVL